MDMLMLESQTRTVVITSALGCNVKQLHLSLLTVTRTDSLPVCD